METNYDASTKYFFECVSKITDQNLDTHHAHGWSARQVIHHMADSETQSYVRLRRLLAEPEGSEIQGYDESAWAECASLGYETLGVEPSLAVIAAVRTSTSQILERLTDDQREMFGIHTESGRYTLADWLEIYTRHPIEHGDQLLRAIDGLE
jgi:hypothetical protein